VNGDMQRPRLCVEWAFGYISNHWSFVNLYQKLRIGLMPVGIYFPVIALFSNLQMCFQRNCPTRSFYQVAGPNIEQYLTPLEVWEQSRMVFTVPECFVARENYMPEEEEGEELPEEQELWMEIEE